MKSFLLGWCALCALNLSAQTLNLNSGPQQVGLLELYTSQGCSSCPPAEKWIGSLAESEQLWSRVVPVAFHVNYWDYIGWKDPYARQTFTQRQRRYAAELGMRTIYTPGFFLNGEEWRWRNAPKRFASSEMPGELTVRLNGSEISVDAAAVAGAGHATIAVLSSGASNAVSRGENHGRTLTTHFSVVEYREFSLGSDGRATQAIELPKAQNGERLALAVWVSGDTKQAPLQATGAWIE